MSWIVNVEGLEFEDLIPHLIKNPHVEDHCDYGMGWDRVEEERVLNQVKEILSDLQEGKKANVFSFGIALAQVLDEIGRCLYTFHESEIYTIYPITIEYLEKFIESAKKNNVKELIYGHDSSTIL